MESSILADDVFAKLQAASVADEQHRTRASLYSIYLVGNIDEKVAEVYSK